MVDETAADGERLEALLQNFLRDGRLIRLPAKFTRRKEILRHLAMRDFRPRTWYAEQEVNDILKAWCEGADAHRLRLDPPLPHRLPHPRPRRLGAVLAS